jgi:hypothetical protein
MLLNSINPNKRIDEIIEIYGINNVRLFITFDDKLIEYIINQNQYKRQGPGGKLYLESVNKQFTNFEKFTGDVDNMIINGIMDVYVLTPDGYTPVHYTIVNQ